MAILVSGGGHLDEALAVLEAFRGHEVILLTYRQKSLLSFRHPSIQRVYFLRLFASRGFLLWASLLVNLFECASIFLKECPRILFSTGSEIAIAPSFLGKTFFGMKIIFLETITRSKSPSRTARILSPLSDLCLVQWEALLTQLGPRAKYAGRVL